jgi:hypothetical protein
MPAAKVAKAAFNTTDPSFVGMTNARKWVVL